MIEGINIVAVLGATFFMMASATVWYSPMLFGRWWLAALGATEAEIEASRHNMLLQLCLMAISYAAALLVIALFLHEWGREFVAPDVMRFAGTLGLLVVALFGSTVLWENKHRTYFLITAGFYLYFIVVGALLIHYWPW